MPMRSLRALLILSLASACVSGGSEVNTTQADDAGSATTVSTTDITVGAVQDEVNLAESSVVTASAALPDQPIHMVNDGVADVASGNFWGSGGTPPQWIEFDLRSESTIHRLVLLVSQSPNGATVHRILGRADRNDPWALLDTLESQTSDLQTLAVEAEPPWEGIRFLRVETILSPSWVSWGEIEVWGVPGAPVTASTRAADLAEGGPDLILYGGAVLTVDSEFEVVDAVAIDDGLISAIGSAPDVLALAGQATRLVDLDGAAVMPGIVDPHVHVIQLQSPDLDAMSAAEAELLVSGRTTVGIPGIDVTHQESFDAFADRAVMRIRLYARYITNCGEPPPDPDFWRHVEFGTDPTARVAFAGVKVFADGGSCNGPAVSWIYPGTFPEGIPFTDWIGSGSLYITSDELAGVVEETQRRGGQVVVHVAGDRAVATALDGMEKALGLAGNPNRHRLDHNDFVPPEMRSRYSELGVVPVVFGDYDSCFEGDGMWSLIAPAEALDYHRQNRSIVEANPGLPVAWHSDLPYTTIDVFKQLQFLVDVVEVLDDGTRCPPPSFLEDQGVSVEQGIRMMTWNAAFAMALEDSVGSIEVGKIADLVIAESNPMTQPPGEIYDNRVVATIVDGSAVFCAGSTICDALASG